MTDRGYSYRTESDRENKGFIIRMRPDSIGGAE